MKASDMLSGTIIG